MMVKSGWNLIRIKEVVSILQFMSSYFKVAALICIVRLCGYELPGDIQYDHSSWCPAGFYLVLPFVFIKEKPVA